MKDYLALLPVIDILHLLIDLSGESGVGRRGEKALGCGVQLLQGRSVRHQVTTRDFILV